MAENVEKKYLDLVGLGQFWTKVKTYVDHFDGTTLKLAKDYVNEAVETINGAASNLADRVTALDKEGGRVALVEADITTLKGEGEGSVKKAVADGIASVVASAPADFDTLKEVADWIANDTTGAAAMQNKIAELSTAVTTLNGDENTAGSVAKAVKDAVAAEAQLRSEADTALSNRIKSLEDAVGGGEGEGETLSSRMDTAESDIDALEALVGKGEGVKSVDQRIADAVDGLKGDVADAYNTLGKLEDAIQTEKSRAELAEQGLSESIQDNADAIQDNADAIAVLNGDENTTGSVAKAVKDAKTELLGSAGDGYKTMGDLETKIKANATTISEHIAAYEALDFVMESELVAISETEISGLPGLVLSA